MGKRPLTTSDCLACANKLNYKLVNKIFQHDTINPGKCMLLIIIRNNCDQMQADTASSSKVSQYVLFMAVFPLQRIRYN